MIYVRIELWPGGDQRRAKVLGEARIANRTGGGTKADYSYTLSGKNRAPLARGWVYDFPRKRLLGWDLLKLVLDHARGGRA